jgi:hypothetical protein
VPSVSEGKRILRRYLFLPHEHEREQAKVSEGKQISDIAF